jgi:hypothetical protein
VTRQPCSNFDHYVHPGSALWYPKASPKKQLGFGVACDAITIENSKYFETLALAVNCGSDDFTDV